MLDTDPPANEHVPSDIGGDSFPLEPSLRSSSDGDFGDDAAMSLFPVLAPRGGLESYAEVWSPHGSEQIAHGAYLFELLHGAETFEVELLRSVDALILNTDSVEGVQDIVRSVRSHSDRSIYLKPIFLYGSDPNVDPFAEALTDGHIYSLERLEKAASVVRTVLKKEEEFVLNHAVSIEDNVLTKLLRFLVSRGRNVIEPVPSRFSKVGCAYPILDVNYQYRNEHESLHVLDAAEADNLLVGEFVEAWYVCSACSAAGILFREVCPDCESSNMREEELVHHFRCAYVGPVSDFKLDANRDALICPKCNHVLSHVGVDYDKPASIFTCQNGHTSQTPPIKARCFACGTETRAERLSKRVFKSYRLTPKGEEKALTGVVANLQSLNEIGGVVDFGVFEKMLEYELHRIRMAGAEGCAAIMHFANASELFSFVGRDARGALLSGLVDLARQHLRAADVLSFRSYSTLFCIAPALEPPDLRDRLAEIEMAWHRKVAEQFAGYEAELCMQVSELAGDRTAEELIDALTSLAVRSPADDALSHA